jgi:hypothetical protein
MMAVMPGGESKEGSHTCKAVRAVMLIGKDVRKLKLRCRKDSEGKEAPKPSGSFLRRLCDTCRWRRAVRLLMQAGTSESSLWFRSKHSNLLRLPICEHLPPFSNYNKNHLDPAFKVHAWDAPWFCIAELLS